MQWMREKLLGRCRYSPVDNFSRKVLVLAVYYMQY